MQVCGSGQYGKLIGFWSTEIGPLNRVIHIWAYESVEARAAARKALMQDAVWTQHFLPMIAQMDSFLLNPVAFSPLQ
jgi:hypothetical protein